MFQLLQALFVMVSAVSAAIAVRDTRRSRESSAREDWRLEKERRLDALADAVVGVGEAALFARSNPSDGPALAIAQLKLRRAELDALNPWIDLETIRKLSDGAPAEIDVGLVESALNDIANNVEEIRDESRKTWRDKRRELRQRW